MEEEHYSLRWDNFNDNMKSGFHDLLRREDFVDVTIAVEGKLIQAHKMVLSVCSPYFKNIFKTTPCQHPVVFLKDVSHKELAGILQFMYLGEVSVQQEELPKFLKTAEALQIKGLTGEGQEGPHNNSFSPGVSDSKGTEEDQLDKVKLKHKSDYGKIPKLEVMEMWPTIETSYNRSRVQYESDTDESSLDLNNFTAPDSQLLEGMALSKDNLHTPDRIRGGSGHIVSRGVARMRRHLHYDGFVYYKACKYDDSDMLHKLSWRCSDYKRETKCPARCRTFRGRIVHTTGIHNHAPKYKPQDKQVSFV